MTHRHKDKSQGEAKESRIVVAKRQEDRQGQRAQREMKLYPTTPLTEGNKNVNFVADFSFFLHSFH